MFTVVRERAAISRARAARPNGPRATEPSASRTDTQRASASPPVRRPTREALLSVVLEPDHEKAIRPVDGGSHHPENREHRDRPHAVLAITVRDLPVWLSGLRGQHMAR